MHFRILGFCLLIMTTLSHAAPGRAPAVEDFVGIEVEQVEATPQGTEVLYNLEQDLGKIESARDGKPMNVAEAPAISAPASTPWSVTTVMGVVFILGLPLISWMLVMNHLRNKASAESASNIEVLEKYRQERARGQGKDEDIKKAS